MKRFIFLFVVSLMLVGCQPEQKPQTRSAAINDFPQQMVGVWESEKKPKWIIRFEPDGSVVKIGHNLAGPVDLREGGAMLEGKEDSYFLFEFAPSEVKYEAESEMISVRIQLTSYTMKLPAGTLEGTNDDHFSGPVSKDGKTWHVNRRTYGTLKGAAEVSKEEIDKHPPIPMVFHKLDLEKMRKMQ